MPNRLVIVPKIASYDINRETKVFAVVIRLIVELHQLRRTMGMASVCDSLITRRCIFIYPPTVTQYTQFAEREFQGGGFEPGLHYLGSLSDI